MEISVQSSELIEALSGKITSLTVELETTRIALKKAQDAIADLEGQLADFPPPVSVSVPVAYVPE